MRPSAPSSMNAGLPTPLTLPLEKPMTDTPVDDQAAKEAAKAEGLRQFMAIKIFEPPDDWDGRLQLFESERSAINQGHWVVKGLTSPDARDLLILGLAKSRRIAEGCVFTAVFAIHGFPAGSANVAHMVHSYRNGVRRALSDEDASAVIAAARAAEGLISDYADEMIAYWAQLPSRA